MGGATRGFYREVLRESLAIVESLGADHLVMGSIAVRSTLGEPVRHDEDIDVLIRVEDADRLLEAFRGAGFAVHRRDESWIYKAARPDVTVDLIFRAGEVIELDDDHVAHARTVEVEGVALRIPSPEDLVVMRAVWDHPDHPGAFHDAVRILGSVPVEWERLVDRGLRAHPRRVLALALYAADADVDVPEPAIARLLEAVARRQRVSA